MKYTILENWNLMRFMRLLIGIIIAIQAIQTLEILPGLLASFFIYQSLTNTGCCANNACSIPLKESTEKKEEIKSI